MGKAKLVKWRVEFITPITSAQPPPNTQKQPPRPCSIRRPASKSCLLSSTEVPTQGGDGTGLNYEVPKLARVG